MENKLEMSHLSVSESSLIKNSIIANVTEIHSPPPSKFKLLKARFNALIDKWWIWEVSVWLVSTAALISTIGVLAAQNQKPIPQWKWTREFRGHEYTVSISINAVISIFATVMKAALAVPIAASISQLKWNWFLEEHELLDYQKFDAAAKGPLGSAILIWHLRGRRLACLGAFLTLGILLLDFAFQQLVTYPLLPHDQKTLASVGVVSYYDKSTLPNDGGVKLRAAGPTNDMIGDIYTAVYGANGTFEMSPYCATGNCDWPSTYASLGTCAQCSDITKTVQKTCGTYNGILASDSDSTAAVLPYCNYTLANDLFVSDKPTGSLTAPYTLVNISGSVFNSTAFPHIGNTFSVLSILRPNWSYRLQNGTYTDGNAKDADGNPLAYYGSIDNVTALQCSMYVCAKQYNGLVKNGSFAETVATTYQNDTAMSNVPFDAPNEDNGETYQNKLAGVYQNITINSPNKSENFTISPYAYQGLAIFFSTFWDGNVTGSDFSGINDDYHYSSDIARLLYGLYDRQVNKTILTLATSITNNMRTTSGESARGVTQLNVATVRVAWRWICLPVLLSLGALLFLVSTMFISSRGSAKLWKGSGLTSFYHPLTGEGRDRLVCVNGPRQMEDIAEEMRVKWLETDKGWRLAPT